METELRILLILGNAVLFIQPHAVIAGRTLLLFDVGGAVALVGMGAMAAAAALRHTVALYAEETLR